MPDQNIRDSYLPVHVVETFVRPRAGYRLLFSFGRDMSLEIIAGLVPDPEFITVASVASRKLVFNTAGQPCLIPRAGHVVHGVVWRVSEPGMAALDIRLAVPSETHRNGVLARSPEGRPVLAEYYTPRLQRSGKVSNAVLEPIIATAIQLEFPDHYVNLLTSYGER
jgi:hypothetical protein